MHRPPCHLQLEGGTNEKTIHQIKINHLLAGIPFGCVAITLIQPFLIEAKNKTKKLIECSAALKQAIKMAKILSNPLL